MNYEIQKERINFQGNTYYLDSFMDDCVLHQKEHRDANRKSASVGTAFLIFFGVLFFLMMAAAITQNPIFMNILGPIFLFGAFGLTAYAAYSRRKNADNYTIDPINYSYVNDFMRSHNIRDFAKFDQSFCVEDGTICTKMPGHFGKTALVFVIVDLIVTGLLLLLGYTFPFESESDATTFIPFSIICCTVAVGTIVFGIVGDFVKKARCSQKVDVVCIHCDSRRRRHDGHTTTLYRPIYYLKHNGRGYILFKNSWSNSNPPLVGDVRKEFYINPENPFDYFEPTSTELRIFFIVFAIMFSVPIFLMLL